jgi:hypothetical protein
MSIRASFPSSHPPLLRSPLQSVRVPRNGLEAIDMSADIAAGIRSSTLNQHALSASRASSRDDWTEFLKGSEMAINAKRMRGLESQLCR